MLYNGLRLCECVWMNLVGRFQTQKMRVRREKLKEKMGKIREKSTGNK